MRLSHKTMFTAMSRPARFPMLAIALVLMAILAAPAHAVLRIDITQGNPEPLPIAIPTFLGDAEYGPQVSEVITNNLVNSGLFRAVDPAAFIERIGDPSATPRFGDWRIINAQALVVGEVQRMPDGRLRAAFRLWDVVAGEQIEGQQFFTDPRNWRRIAHVISDAIYERLTGERGYFDTRVVFVDERGPKEARIKRLAIMDQDGANVRFLTDDDPRNLVLTPRFSPSSQEITYMSYATGVPRVFLMNIDSNQREPLGDFPDMTSAPRFSPDGQTVVLSLQQGGNANIFTVDLRSRRTTRITNSPSIDTSPSFSPDGRQIVFESDRGGSQQLYVMNADGSNVERISFGQGSYSTPVWSPRGDLIAFTKRVQGQFAIGVMRPDGSAERVLTAGFHNEGPTWAPNGRVLMFFREMPGAQGGPQLWSIDLTGYNERRIPTPAFASDPAWSPVLR